MVKERIAIIPARGGSKRIPRKNIRLFQKKPLIAWTVEAAIDSQLFDQILVSTDDAEIADVAKSHGASVPFLRELASDDHTPVSTATVHGLRQAQAYWNETYDTVVQLMPSCPLRTARHIIAAVDHFESAGHAFQISCFRYGWMNPWWATKLDANGKPQWLFGDMHHKRSQELEDLFCPTGAIWIAKAEALLTNGTFYGPEHIFYPMEWTAAVDIDDVEDLNMAAALSEMNRISGDQ